MLNFTLHMPTTIHFGRDKIKMLDGELSKHAKKILFLYGQGSIKKYGIYEQVITRIQNTTIPFFELAGVQPNPRLSLVYKGIEICRKESIDFILAVGGGSVIDTAKAIAAGVLYDGDVWDFYIAHSGPPKALPIGTVLTLAATGSEMNGNSVITNEFTKEKCACSSPMLIPSFSILNPEYTFTVDPTNTAAGIADIMAHIFEYYLSPVPHAAVQDRLAEGLLKVCLTYGPIAYKRPKNYDARANIMWGSSLALNGLIGKGKISDWTCHAIEHELSGLYDIPHGIGLAILIPNYMKVFLSEETMPNFVACGINVFGIDKNESPHTIVDETIQKTRTFFNSLGLPATLNELNITDKYFATIVRNTLKRRGKVGHHRQLSKEDILNILKLSL